MIVKTGKLIIGDNEINIRDFKMSEDTSLQASRLEVLRWAQDELDYAINSLGSGK